MRLAKQEVDFCLLNSNLIITTRIQAGTNHQQLPQILAHGVQLGQVVEGVEHFAFGWEYRVICGIGNLGGGGECVYVETVLEVFVQAG